MDENEQDKFSRIALNELSKTNEYKDKFATACDAINELFNFIDNNGITGMDDFQIAGITKGGLIVPMYEVHRIVKSKELDDADGGFPFT